MGRRRNCDRDFREAGPRGSILVSKKQENIDTFGSRPEFDLKAFCFYKYGIYVYIPGVLFVPRFDHKVLYPYLFETSGHVYFPIFYIPFPLPNKYFAFLCHLARGFHFLPAGYALSSDLLSKDLFPQRRETPRSISTPATYIQSVIRTRTMFSFNVNAPVFTPKIRLPIFNDGKLGAVRILDSEEYFAEFLHEFNPDDVADEDL